MSLLDMPLPSPVRGRLVSRGWRVVAEYRPWIRAAREGGESIGSLAERFNCTPQNIHRVLK